MTTRENREKLAALWKNNDHWSGGVYFCKTDPRLIVPKRIVWTGWTFNFGHPWAGAALVGIILLPILVLIAINALLFVPNR